MTETQTMRVMRRGQECWFSHDAAQIFLADHVDVQTEAKIKILFVSPYPTDPQKRPYPKYFISIFSQEFIFFLMSLQTVRENCPT